MNVSKEGKKFFDNLAKKYSESTKHEITVDVKNNSMNSTKGIDSRAGGKEDIGIEFSIEYREKSWDTSWYDARKTFANINISEGNACGVAFVSGIMAFEGYTNSKRDKMFHNESTLLLKEIIMLLSIGDKSSQPEFVAVFNSHYSLGRSLFFMGNNNRENKIYKDLGFIKVAPYTNPRYSIGTRFVYIFESIINENSKENPSYPKYAIDFKATRKKTNKVKTAS